MGFTVRPPTPSVLAITLALLAAGTPALAKEADIVLERSSGEVRAQAPGSKDYLKVEPGARLADGTRLKTDAGAEARLKYPDGSIVEVKAGSELIVRGALSERPSGVVLFLGRVWAKIARSAGGNTSFEVQSANAVAGVRGTEFEVGVGLDGSARVLVAEGEVKVASEAREESVRGGQAIESEQDNLGKVGKAPANADWDGWFSACARRMEKTGLDVAKSLNGRLSRRKSQVEKLVADQKGLRQQIERLEASKRKGASVDEELKSTLAKLARVTERLEDMKARLQGAFGLFERWGAVAAKGDLQNGKQIGVMAKDIAKVAADFADMIEEGTDMSKEGMEEMMDDMHKGKRDKPKDNAADELFR